MTPQSPKSSLNAAVPPKPSGYVSPDMIESGYAGRSSWSDKKTWRRFRLPLVGSKRLIWIGVAVLTVLAFYLHNAIRLGTYKAEGYPGAGRQNAALSSFGDQSYGWDEFTQVGPAGPPDPQGYSPFYGGNRNHAREIDIASDALPLSASLRERLDVWRDAPGGRGDATDVEVGTFVQFNLEQCATIGEQHNRHMIEKSVNVWSSMNRTTIHNNRMRLINYMESLIGRQELEDYGEGRGIVMVAGNQDTLMRALWSVHMLRSYNSTLPVQIYHFPDESPPEDDPIRAGLSELGAELVEAKGQHRDKDEKKSYHLKAIAVIQCPWREVLYLDSDSIPAKDPEYMFDAPSYKRLGIFATPDFWKTSANNAIWAIAGVKCRNEWEMETGQMFVDKRLHLDVFYLIKYMLQNHEWWFYFSDGDKDIFRWALLMLRKRWAVPARWVAAGGLPGGTPSGDFCGHTMVQHDAWGEPLFVHYNLLKQIPSGVGLGWTWGRSKQLPLFDTSPATPATARLGGPRDPPPQSNESRLGDVDCDMLADADEYGIARAPAPEMVMRRAVRERGMKAKYHGGVTSALCIDFDYVDPRPKSRQEADRLEAEKAKLEEEKASGGDAENPPPPAAKPGEPVIPDWKESPVDIVGWDRYEHLASFEQTLYGFGFIPGSAAFF